MTRNITIEHNGTTYYGKVATIKRTTLGAEDHGILTASLQCEGDGWGVSVGGYALDAYDESEKRRIPTAYGLDHVVQMMHTVGVDAWEKVTGREVLVLFGDANSWGGAAKGIAHISDESKVLILTDHLAEWKARGRA